MGKRIKDLSRAETDGYLAVDNATNGTGKMNTSVIFNNFAPAFDPTRTSENPYLENELVMFEGKLYKFLNSHYGAWDNADAVQTSEKKEVGRINVSWTRGYRLNRSAAVAAAGYEYSDYIPIPETGLFVSSYLFKYSNICFYDAAKNYIGFHGNESNINVLYEETCYRTDFDGAAYIRVSNYYTSNKNRGVWLSFNKLAQGLAANFDTAKNYSAGDLVEYEGGLFRFDSDHSAGAWVGTDANKTLLGDEFNRIDIKWNKGYCLNSAGVIVGGGSEPYEFSDYIPKTGGGFYIHTYLFNNTSVVLYDKNKSKLQVITGTTSQNELVELVIKPEDYPALEYIRVTNYTGNKRRFVKSLLGESEMPFLAINSFAEFDSTKNYAAGKQVLYRNGLYRFKVDHSFGAWNDLDVVPTTLEKELKRLDVKWTQQAYITNAGVVVEHSDYEYSDYIAIPVSGVHVTTKLFTNTNISIYDKDKHFIHYIAGTTPSSQDVDVTITRETYSGAAYIRIDNPKSNKSRGAWAANEFLDVESMGQQEYCRYNGKEAATFRKGVAIGDSLTSGTFNYDYEAAHEINVFTDARYSWPAYYQKMHGVEMTNKGHGGTTPESWYASHSSDDLSGHDFAIIALGVNCAFHDHGGWTSDSDQALKDIITKLENENEGIKIFVCTIFASTSYSSTTMSAISEGIRTSVAEIQQTDNDVYLLDHAAYGTTAKTEYWHGHATATGYERLAEDLFNYVSYIMSQNMDDFKFVQFIGTNYEP